MTSNNTNEHYFFRKNTRPDDSDRKIDTLKIRFINTNRETTQLLEKLGFYFLPILDILTTNVSMAEKAYNQNTEATSDDEFDYILNRREFFQNKSFQGCMEQCLRSEEFNIEWAVFDFDLSKDLKKEFPDLTPDPNIQKKFKVGEVHFVAKRIYPKLDEILISLGFSIISEIKNTKNGEILTDYIIHTANIDSTIKLLTEFRSLIMQIGGFEGYCYYEVFFSRVKTKSFKYKNKLLKL
jgi:hypothetical protein